MSQSNRKSGRSVVKDDVALNARRASGRPKSNATSFKKGRKKTGGRKAGTPNKTTRILREVVLAAAEAAGNELRGNGDVGYMTWFALNYPPSFVPLYVKAMPQQLEPEEPDEDVVLHTIEEVREHLRQRGIPPEHLARALLGRPLTIEEYLRAGPTSSTDDHRVEDDASDASTREDEVK